VIAKPAPVLNRPTPAPHGTGDEEDRATRHLLALWEAHLKNGDRAEIVGGKIVVSPRVGWTSPG